jgi:Ca2+-binding RTX toxin-like protein
MTYDHQGNFASYAGASAGVTASLANPLVNTGAAVGDTYDSITGLIGSPFDDALIGSTADNRLAGGPGADLLDGGEGFDYASYQSATAGVTASLADPGGNFGESAGDSYVSIEGLIGSSFDDILIGDGGDNWLNGGPGADRLDGGPGSGDYASYLDSPVGLTASLADPELNTGEATGDTYVSIERLAGSRFDDVLTGDAKDNALRGHGGADRLDGGAGFDFASYFASPAGLTVSLANAALNTGEAAGDTYVSIEGLTGSAFDDVLVGNSASNTLIGGGGADQLDGGAGFDYAAYNLSTVGLTASLANPANNTGEAAGDSYTSIEGLIGSSFDDVLTGDGADNWLRGNGGSDRLEGGAGFDFASYLF